MLESVNPERQIGPFADHLSYLAVFEHEKGTYEKLKFYGEYFGAIHFLWGYRKAGKMHFR